MLLIPFLEVTTEYLRLKAIKEGEKQIISLEKAMAKDVAKFFKHQGNVLIKHLPETFDLSSFSHAWDTTQLVTYLLFRDLIIKHKRRAVYVGIRTLEKELAVSPIQEAAKPRTTDPFKISFDEFDQDAYNQIEAHAGEKISQINDTTRTQIHDIIAEGFKGELQPDGTTKYKSYQQIAKDIKDRFSDFATAAPQAHIRNRAELVAVTEIRDGYETSKAGVRDKLEARGWIIEKKWSTMGDDKVSELCRNNAAAGWIPNNQAFPSGHMQSPGHPACRCNCQSRVGGRKEQSSLPQDRWIVTRNGDTVTVKRNPKYDLSNTTTPTNQPPSKPIGKIQKQLDRRAKAKQKIETLGKRDEALYPQRNGNPITIYRGRDSKEIGNWTLFKDKKIPDDALETFNAVIDDVTKDFEKLGIPAIRGQKTITGNAWANMGDGILGINKSDMSKSYFKVWKKGMILPDSNWKQGDSISGRPFSGKDYFSTPEERYMYTLYHESGHHIHQLHGVNGDLSKYRSQPLTKALDTNEAALDLTNTSPSRYGTTNSHEWFAENYALIKMGRQDLLSSLAIQLFKDLSIL